jgi:threonine/homoserine/homoserine lactone efflux protein
MVDPIAFTLAALTLLLMPGPTNTLLLTSGTVAGWRRSIGLAVAELLGYSAAILLLVVGIGPLVRAFPPLALGLKIVAALYLISVAVVLWRRGGVETGRTAPIEFHRLFVTTLFNPKALIFAFFIVPHLFDGRLGESPPYLLALGIMI